MARAATTRSRATSKTTSRPAYHTYETEADFQAAVIQLAEVCGWLWHHTPDGKHNARAPKGVAHPSKGAPDLLLARDWAFFAELKKQNGRLSKEQKTWITTLRAANQVVFVWRPSDWPEIERTLTAPLRRVA